MMELICAIPENIGWVIVGAMGMLAVVMMVKLGKLIATAIKERLEDAKEETAE